MRIDSYDITSDSNQFIVNEVKINTDEKSKNFGKEMLTKPRHFTSVQGVLSHIAQNELMVSVNEFDSVETVISDFKISLGLIEQQIKDACK